MGNYLDGIKQLLSDPQKLKQKKPFTRGIDFSSVPLSNGVVNYNEILEARLPHHRDFVVTQEQYMRELDPQAHDVLFDDNIPSICVKTSQNGYQDINFEKMSVPIQRNIKNKQLLHLTGNKMQFTLIDLKPSAKQNEDFITFKQYWDLRNQDGMKTKMVDTQLSYGDAGLLYYFDYKGRIKSRILSFADGYVLCPHNDQNGDRILESVYYKKDNVEYIDSYDDTYMYRYKQDVTGTDGWIMEEPIAHGFPEIPLITKRGKVAWDNVQTIITSYEILYNVFNAIQRRHGWGLLYIKGRFSDTAKKLAGSIVLNDKSLEGKGDAKFLTPPSPQGTIDTLQLLLDTIQLGSGTTFLLPKDIKTGGDISGITLQLVQSQDIETAMRNSIEWQNVADKMVRLFKYGLSVELVNSGKEEYKMAITDFENLNINAKFKPWRPMNDYEYNQMLTILSGAGLISKETGIQKNTESTPDELSRVEREKNAQTTNLVQEAVVETQIDEEALNTNNMKV